MVRAVREWLERVLSLNGEATETERSQRVVMLCVLALGIVLEMLLLSVFLNVIEDYPVHSAAMCLLILISTMTLLRLVFGYRLEMWYITTMVCLFGVISLMMDLSARTVARVVWPLFIVVGDLMLVMRVDSYITTGYVVSVVVWLFVVYAETVTRFGLFDVPGLVSQELRRNGVREGSGCVELPCATKWNYSIVDLLTALVVFLVDFIATRAFARQVLAEQGVMQHTIATVQEVTRLLARYDVDGVSRMLADTELPPVMQETLHQMEGNLRRYRPYLPAALFEEEAEVTEKAAATTSVAPSRDGEVATIVFTDIRASTSIWECAPDGMRAGLKIHNRVMREVMQMFGGYEVKTIGDAFMIAFETTADGVDFALCAHEKLLAADWPASLLEVPICAPHDSLWGGLTVRIGVNTGPVAIEQNTLTGRTDYFGHTVNVASRLESTCTPGAVAVPSDLWTSDCGTCSGVEGMSEALDLKGVTGAIFVCPVWPVSLVGRKHRRLDSLAPASTDSRQHLTPCASYSASVAPETAPPMLGQVLGTIGVAELAAIDKGTFALHCINAGLSTLTAVLDQSGGSLVTLLGNCVCVSWNVTRSAPAHMENAIRFAQRMGTTTALEGLGLASGPVQHGDVGARRQRFVTVMGTTVRRSWTLCEEAVHEGVCLYEPPVGTVFPTSLASDLETDERRIGVYKVFEPFPDNETRQQETPAGNKEHF